MSHRYTPCAALYADSQGAFYIIIRGGLPVTHCVEMYRPSRHARAAPPYIYIYEQCLKKRQPIAAGARQPPTCCGGGGLRARSSPTAASATLRARRDKGRACRTAPALPPLPLRGASASLRARRHCPNRAALLRYAAAAVPTPRRASGAPPTPGAQACGKPHPHAIKLRIKTRPPRRGGRSRYY